VGEEREVCEVTINKKGDARGGKKGDLLDPADRARGEKRRARTPRKAHYLYLFKKAHLDAGGKGGRAFAATNVRGWK